MVGGIELRIDEIAEKAVDLGGLEASNLHIEAELRQQVSKLAQLSGKQLAVPPRVQRNFVVGKRQRALLGLSPRFRQRHYRDVRQSSPAPPDSDRVPQGSSRSRRQGSGTSSQTAGCCG